MFTKKHLRLLTFGSLLSVFLSLPTAQAQSYTDANQFYADQYSALLAPEATADIVTITGAQYITSRGTLRVQATGTDPTAALQLFVTSTNEFIGILTKTGRQKFTGRFSVPTNPQNITVLSTSGGSDSAVVLVR